MPQALLRPDVVLFHCWRRWVSVNMYMYVSIRIFELQDVRAPPYMVCHTSKYGLPEFAAGFLIGSGHEPEFLNPLKLDYSVMFVLTLLYWVRGINSEFVDWGVITQAASSWVQVSSVCGPLGVRGVLPARERGCVARCWVGVVCLYVYGIIRGAVGRWDDARACACVDQTLFYKAAHAYRTEGMIRHLALCAVASVRSSICIWIYTDATIPGSRTIIPRE